MFFEPDYDTSRNVALLTARVVTGILFIAQGYDKLFVLGIKKTIQPFAIAFAQKNIPVQVLSAAILVSSCIEFFGGLFLLVGFERDAALFMLLINMIGVSFGFCLIKPIWDLQHYFPRLLLLLLVILLPPEWDAWRLDHFFK